MHRVYLIMLLLLSIEISLCQVSINENLIKITKAYLEYQLEGNQKTLGKDNILILGAESVNKDSLWFEVSMAPVFLISGLKYSKVYQLEGYKLAIKEDLDRSNILKGLFKELPYENLNKSTLFLDVEYNTWRLLLDKKNRIISIESKYPPKDVLNFLRKNKAIFSKHFHFI